LASIVDLIEAAEAAHSRRVAVVAGAVQFTFAEVSVRSNRAANLLRELHGSGPGVVALLIGNQPEAVELDIALLKAGLARLSVNPRLADDERRYIIENSETRVLVYSPEYADFVDSVVDEITDLVRVELSGGTAKQGLSYEHELVRASKSLANRGVVSSDPSLLMYTSGTTGRPKGAVWTFASRTAAVKNMLLNELDTRAATAMLHVGSLSHGSGSKVVPVYLRGGRNILCEHFDPEQFLDVAATQKATATFVVPTMVQMLVETASSTTKSLPDLQHVAYGGAKMPLGTIEAALDRYGPIFAQVYGSCEAPHPILMLDQRAHETRDRSVLSTAGHPSVGVDVRIGDQRCVPGALGEIRVGGPSVFAGYWGDETATSEALVDGFYHTGDVGRVDEEGRVEIVDRIKSMLISGGFNVYPAEVERVLLEHRGVRQASVYGIPDQRWGEIVAAAIVADSGVTEEDLVGFCAQRLAGYKKPRRVLFVDTFPTGPTGKVSVNELRRQHLESLGSR
jgi:acyl-CoA synthetase (AMP-forming)/AMP-acid ligase II